MSSDTKIASISHAMLIIRSAAMMNRLRYMNCCTIMMARANKATPTASVMSGFLCLYSSSLMMRCATFVSHFWADFGDNLRISHGAHLMMA